MADPLGLVLRVVHIFCGVFWAGATLLLSGFIEPAVKALGPDGGKFMQHMMEKRRFGIYMTSAALLTVASGLTMWHTVGGHPSAWLASGYGVAIAIGSLAGLAALASGLIVNAPTSARMARIAREIQSASGPPRAEQIAEMAQLQKRLHQGGLASAWLLTLAVLTMAAARHL